MNIYSKKLSPSATEILSWIKGVETLLQMRLLRAGPCLPPSWGFSPRVRWHLPPMQALPAAPWAPTDSTEQRHLGQEKMSLGCVASWGGDHNTGRQAICKRGYTFGETTPRVLCGPNKDTGPASLVAQRRRIRLPVAGDPGSIPGPGRSLVQLPWSNEARAPQSL